jgi:diguanylate cyclase (GGDEF)-like protein
VTRRDGWSGRGKSLAERRRGDERGSWTPAIELDLLTRDLGRKLDAEIVVIFGSRDVGQPANAISRWGVRPSSQPLALPRDEGLVGRMLESGQSVVGPLDPTLDRTLMEAAGGLRLTHCAAVPVGSPSGLRGALCAGFSRTPPGEPTTTLWVAESYARLVALCLHDPGVLHELLLAAHQDRLTGCLNYGSVRDELIAEIKRSARHDLHVSCCFIDLDGFKAVNDHFGHLYGNGVLAGVGESLRHNVRSFDTVGRYGGDEFFAILPETREDQAKLMAERLRECVRSTVLPSGEPLEASIGISEWKPGSSAELMVGEADRALFAAKRQGAGIVASGELGPVPGSVDEVDQVA